MKTIGLLGGMSWESTQVYYRLLNEQVRARLGGLHSAKIILHSVDFAEIEALQRREDWPAMAELLSTAAKGVASAGADFLLICTNTMHRVAPEIARAIDIPLLHIADATAAALRRGGITRVGLLGTRFTMEQAFFSDRLADFGIEVLVPEAPQREIVHRIIYEELCRGAINPGSRRAYLQVVEALASRGAEAVILGCTEIGLLLRPEDTDIPLYDTTEIHASQAIDYALGERQEMEP
ncbi:aspartate/glutamate racemase family protein [Wenzhouxiangella sp. XN24]|uniref:aspartate/glutamate racemase family protein n=1 Tax=Wenzhouxiangella sp. XN24 TaxID=2713569 RepID=UPI0013EA2D24|nr:aspartate/glutamate racemase family protein [Wenzhouxiangella sp. XN24]NGX15046.1 aspartate/glutamate racemase family protein [Wenzhouxiangella sp. XN24]